jgi:tetratricopeptide (TPR) repeat protein
VEWTGKNDPEDVKKLLKDYERQPEEIRLSRMQALSLIRDGKGIPALCRLVRFEKSELLAKMAVIKLLQSPYSAEFAKGGRAESIRKLCGKSSRPSTSWIIAWLNLAGDPREITQWNALAEKETSLLRHSPAETSHDIAGGLIRYQAAWLNKRGQSDQAASAMHKLLDLENGDPDTLADLLDWLVQQKAWKLVDELNARFEQLFNAKPTLLYVLAQAKKEQGDAEKAEDIALKAFRLDVGREDINIKLVGRYLIAQNLSQRGLFAWARREYEYIISRTDSNNTLTAESQLSLSEMLHDQGEDFDAARVLETMLKKGDAKTNASGAGRIASTLQRLYMFRKKTTEMPMVERILSDVRARLYYFQSCHWQKVGDQEQRRECLEKALALEPGDVDVLIACYRLEGETPEYRKKVIDLIRQTADDLRSEISVEPGNPSLYNQYAWLVGNTEGDFDEALKFSQKSVELSPDSGGYYDTLARVYYAKGDYENAFLNQQKAAEMEPHSGLVAKQLELFRKAREGHKKSP